MEFRKLNLFGFVCGLITIACPPATFGGCPYCHIENLKFLLSEVHTHPDMEHRLGLKSGKVNPIEEHYIVDKKALDALRKATFGEEEARQLHQRIAIG